MQLKERRLVTIAEELKLTITGNLLSVNHMYGYRAFGKGIINKYVTKEGKDFKKKWIPYIQEEVKKQGWIKTEKQLLYMDCIFYFPQAGKTDVDNKFKCLQDTLTESLVIFDDDCNILPRTYYKYIDTVNPRVEITIHKSEQIGIFNTYEEYKTFINNNCDNCKTYKNDKCSRLTKALEGRILSDEYNKDECLKKKNK
jgi:Holliday junction resolvase RusA-like endonuclease